MPSWRLPNPPPRRPILSAASIAGGLVLWAVLVGYLSLRFGTEPVSCTSAGPNAWFRQHLGTIDVTVVPGTETLACLGHPPLEWTLIAVIAVGPLLVWAASLVRWLRANRTP